MVAAWLTVDHTSARAGALLVGLWVFGTGEAMLLASTLGNSPWTVLAEGISEHTPWSVGGATLAVSVVVLLGWLPLRERPGMGTVLNAIVIAIALDVMLAVLGDAHSMAVRVVLMFGGVVVLAAGGALYLTCNFGPRPARRAHDRNPHPLRVVDRARADRA